MKFSAFSVCHAPKMISITTAILVTLVILSLGAPIASAYDPTQEISEVQAMIDAKGYSWIAGENEINRMAPEDRPQIGGSILAPGETGILDKELFFSRTTSREVPTSWDWRFHGGVTVAKQQGGCGSCWAFAGTGAFESIILINTGRTENLSEQQVLVCNYAGQGCSGGWASTAYDLFMFPGAVSETCMPYTGNDNQPCVQDQCEIVDVLDSWELITPATMAEIKEACYVNPIAVSLTAYNDWYSYGGGCYEHDGLDQTNHEVLLVGWDDDMCEGQGAWLIKNSWGTGWGFEGGFMWIRYGDCNLASRAWQIYYTGIGDTHIVHESLGDTEDVTNPYVVNCSVKTRDYPVDASTVYLHYDVGAGDVDVLMTEVRDGEELTFTAEIPAQEIGTVVSYWISASDTNGTPDVEPAEAPTSRHEFRVLRIILEDPIEVYGTWTVGDVGDDATSGIWDWGIPDGTYGVDDVPCNPDRDHTPGINFFCYTTGSDAGGFYWDNDVDGGKTTLFSPIVDLSTVSEATVNYYRWYINNGQNYPLEDYWQVDVTNNGVDWVNLEYTNLSDSFWKLIEFDLHDYITLTHEVQFRFIASDYTNPSIVEAGVDDVLIFTTQAGISDVGNDETIAQVLRLSPGPSLFRNTTTLSYELPADASGSLEIYGVDGRVIRTLVNGEMSRGLNRVTWDGLSNEGDEVPSGYYLIRLSTPNAKAESKIIKIR